MASRNPQLEAIIACDPTAVDPYLVYADWLQARGDPQGELIALMHAAAAETETASHKRVERAIRKYRASLGIGRGFELSWRLGFIETITVKSRDAAALAALLDTDAARFVQRMIFTAASSPLLGDVCPALPQTLRLLCLAGNRIDSLAPLEQLPQLQSLALEQTTRIKDLGPLAALVALRTADLSGSRAVELTPLSDLALLRELTLPENTVKDLEPLRRLRQLERLSGWARKITDLSVLQALPKLRRLDLDFAAKLASLDDLAPLRQLEHLAISFRDTPTDLEPLSQLTGLRSLDLNGTAVTDLGPLKNLVKLRELRLQRTQVADLTPLRDLVELEVLDLRFVETLTDLSPLADLRKLKKLDVVATSVTAEQRRRLRAALPELRMW